MSYRDSNRKLLVSVFNSQEAREAVLGGGRIIDSEDPRSALGNIKPRQIMAISDSVLNFKRDLDVQLSTNIGEDQLLFDRSESGLALEKSPYEIAGKASQAAIGVAVSMGVRVHPCNWVKVGVDGMDVSMVGDVLEEVVQTLNRTEQCSHSQVMSVLFAQDMEIWDQRKGQESVIKTMVQLREFHPAKQTDESGAVDLAEYAVGTLLGPENKPLYSNQSEISLSSLIKNRVLPDGVKHSYIRLNELFPHSAYFGSVSGPTRRTSWDVIKAMVDVTADSGADAIMLDTRIQSKVSRISLIDTASTGLVDLNQFDQKKKGLTRTGILSLDDIRFFVDYCHYKGVVPNLAGSIQSYQAQQVWAAIPELNQMSTRGGSSGVSSDPFQNQTGTDSRQFRVIKRDLVKGLAPPELGGVMNIPEYMWAKEG